MWQAIYRLRSLFSCWNIWHKIADCNIKLLFIICLFDCVNLDISLDLELLKRNRLTKWNWLLNVLFSQRCLTEHLMENANTWCSWSMFGDFNHGRIIFILNALSLFLCLLRFPNRHIFLATLYPWEAHGHLGLIICLWSRDTELFLFRVLTKQNQTILFVKRILQWIKGRDTKCWDQCTLILDVRGGNQVRGLEGLQDGARLRKESLVCYQRWCVILLQLVESRGSNIFEGLLKSLRLVEHITLFGVRRMLWAGWSTATHVGRPATLRGRSLSIHVKNIHDNRSLHFFFLVLCWVRLWLRVSTRWRGLSLPWRWLVSFKS